MSQIKRKYIVDGAINVAKTDGSFAQQSALTAEQNARIAADAAEVIARDAAILVETNRALAAEALLIPLAQKGAASGVAPLDSNGLVPAANLPSYVDDVLEYADLASLPVTGEAGKIYIATDSGFIYRWSGTVYVNVSITPGTTDTLLEGSTNLYFTDARAKAAAVVNSMATQYNDIAPSVEAVYGHVAIVTGNLGFSSKWTVELDAAAITNQYVRVPGLPKTGSVHLSIDGVEHYEDEDFTVTNFYDGDQDWMQINFINGLATLGVSELVAGDKLRLSAVITYNSY